ncbi:MAG: bifunctional nuclease family protein, partial [Thermoleophilia bacterium]|nr:bifunctional nuclease family protein [Thermoleophilia bacterium]
TVEAAGAERQLDARPSDALAIAVRAGAPIFAAEEIVAESGIEFEQEDANADSAAVVEQFRSFLEDVNPDDFLRNG